jgi:hypothetical protein
MQIFQWILFSLLIGVSSFFTVLLALGLGVTPVERFILVLGSLGIEGLKTYALIAANTAVLERLKLRAIGLYSVYGFVAIYSLSACLGYALVTVDRMGAVSTVAAHSEEIEVQQRALANYEEQITALRGVVANHQLILRTPVDSTGGTYQRALSRKGISEALTRIDGYIVKRSEGLAKITEWRERDRLTATTTRRSLYEVIGSSINIKTATVAFTILLIFSLAIELGIFLTSPHGKIHSTIKLIDTNSADITPIEPKGRTRLRRRETKLTIEPDQDASTIAIVGEDKLDPPTPITRQG